jgi:transposase-like protein
MSAAATFTPIQQQVIAHVSMGLSFTAAAEAAGVHRNTISNWRREIPSFATAFEKAARDQARAFQEEALDAVPQATQAILAVLNDPATSPALRLRAAGMILKWLTSNPSPRSAKSSSTSRPASGPRSKNPHPTPKKSLASEPKLHLRAPSS